MAAASFLAHTKKNKYLNFERGYLMSTNLHYNLTGLQDVEDSPNFTHYSNKCNYCNIHNIMIVHIAHLEDWQNGTLAQKAFSYLDADQRELIMTGTHSGCWDKIFPDI